MPTDMNPPKCGFYGKLPMRGDFVTRDLPSGFVTPWDDWLQHSLSFAQVELGEAWLELFLNCPIWRFAIGADGCGPEAVIGVMIPSVDSVGRYFPLVVASLSTIPCSPASAVAETAWFEMAEAAVLLALDEGTTFDAFETAVAALPARAGDYALPSLPAVTSLSGGLPAALSRLTDSADGTALWWTDGTPMIEAAALRSRGLPTAEQAVALFDGQWVRRGWSVRS